MNPFEQEEQSILLYINYLYETGLIKDIPELIDKNLGTLSLLNSDSLDRPLNNAQALADIINKCLYCITNPTIFDSINNLDLFDKVFFNKKPSKTLISKVFIVMLPTYLLEQTSKAANELPFLYNHVAGDDRYSPRRGVCVQNNTKKFFDKANWTLTKNKSNCTMQQNTVIMKQELKNLIPFINSMAEKCFPDNFRRTEGSFGLFVANKYNKGQDQIINPHTDDQEWYPDPAIFASVTFFPDGIPEDPKNTFRFQVRDPENNQWVDMFLPHGSITLMCANLEHRVSKPIGDPNKSLSRINLTFRNLLDPYIDPIGYLIGISNHYRYYGIPNKAIIPENIYETQLDIVEEILDKYRNLNPKMIVCLGKDNEVRKKLKKKLRSQIENIYIENDLVLNVKINKANIVLELLQEGFDYLEKNYV
jgi:hypothetical protein